MPFIDSKVNVKTTEEQQKALKERLGQAIAILPGKSETWLMLNLADEQTMYFQGNDAPCAYIKVSIFGSPDSDHFVKMTGELCAIYEEILGIPANRVYVKYDTTRDWGWNGSNF